MQQPLANGKPIPRQGLINVTGNAENWTAESRLQSDMSNVKSSPTSVYPTVHKEVTSIIGACELVFGLHAHITTSKVARFRKARPGGATRCTAHAGGPPNITRIVDAGARREVVVLR